MTSDATHPEHPVDDILSRGRLGSYRIRKELGHGGMGLVYLAEQEGLDRLVALKVVRPHLAVNPDLMARFVREYTTHAKLEHPNIVRFFDAGQADGFHYCAMEYLEADPLDQVIQDHDTTSDFALARQVARSLASALVYLHGQGTFHRDIKPSNVMVERGSGRIVLMDFGLVKPKDVTQLTRVGKTVGSPRYMAPETLQGAPADSRTDIYQVGVTLFQVATGRPAFEAPDLTALAAMILYGDPVSARALCPLVPEGMDRLIQNCMARLPDDRYQDGDALRQDVVRLEAGLPVRILAAPVEEAPAPPGTPSGSGAAPRLTTGSLAAVSAQHSRVNSGSASFSSSHPSVSGGHSSSLTFTPTGRIPPILPLLALGALASFVPFFLSSGGVSYRAEHVRAIPGVRAALLRWRGEPAYPPKVLVRPAGREDPDLVRIFLGQPAANGEDSEVVLEPLDPELTYEARIAFPGGAVSIPHQLPRVAADEPRVDVDLGYDDEGVAVRLRCHPPIRGSLRYRAHGSWREVGLGNEFRRDHDLRLPAPPDRGAWEDVTLSARAVGLARNIPLPPIPGRSLRRESIAGQIEALDMSALARAVRSAQQEATRALTRDEVLALVSIPGLKGLLADLEASGGLSSGPGADRRLFEALQRLEAVDAVLDAKEHPRVLQLPRAYPGVVRFAYPAERPAGGVRVGHWEIGEATSFLPQNGSKSSQTILQIYTGTTSTQRHEDVDMSIPLRGSLSPQGRSGIAVLARNLHPEYLFRFTFDGGPQLALWNESRSFPGLFWAQMAGLGRGDEVALAEAIQAHQNWIYAEFPAGWLEPPRTQLHMQLESHAGVSPDFLVDAYEVWIWPEAPPFPGQSS